MTFAANGICCTRLARVAFRNTQVTGKLVEDAFLHRLPNHMPMLNRLTNVAAGQNLTLRPRSRRN